MATYNTQSISAVAPLATPDGFVPPYPVSQSVVSNPPPQPATIVMVSEPSGNMVFG